MPRIAVLKYVSRSTTAVLANTIGACCSYFSRSLTGRFGGWYRRQQILHPSWIGPCVAEVRMHSIDGCTLDVQLAEEQGIHLLQHGTWQSAVTERISRSLQSGDTFVDVGANMGYFSLLASRRVGRTGKVIAVEPCHANISRLAHNLSINKCDNVILCTFALSSSPGIARLSEAPWHNSGLCSLRSDTISQYISTATTSLDNLVNDIAGAQSLRLIKIDVEGFEPEVLQGMAHLLSAGRIENIVLEASPEWYSVADVIKAMQEHGFLCDVLTDGNWIASDGEQEFRNQTELWFWRPKDGRCTDQMSSSAVTTA